MTGNAGALLDTGKAPRLLAVAALPQPGPWPRPQATPHTMHYGAQTRLLRCARNHSC